MPSGLEKLVEYLLFYNISHHRDLYYSKLKLLGCGIAR